MPSTNPKFSLGLFLTIIGTLIVGAIQLGGVEKQVENTAKEIEEAKLATAVLATQSDAKQYDFAQRLSRLEERIKK